MDKVLDYSNMTAEEFRSASEKVLKQMAAVEEEARSAIAEYRMKKRATAQISELSHSSLTQTTVLRGAFKDDIGTKKEFFDNIKLQQEFSC